MARYSREQTILQFTLSRLGMAVVQASQTELVFCCAFSTCDFSLALGEALGLQQKAGHGVAIPACVLNAFTLLVVSRWAQIEAGQVCMIWNQSIESERWSQLADCLNIHEAGHQSVVMRVRLFFGY